MNKVVPWKQASFVEKMRWFYYHSGRNWTLNYWSWGELKANYQRGRFVYKMNTNTIFVNKRH